MASHFIAPAPTALRKIITPHVASPNPAPPEGGQQAYTQENAVTAFLHHTFSDPVAVFTVALVASTILLWRATLRLAREARESALDQAEKTERSIVEAASAARAMERQNEIAEDTAKRRLRAYLCLRPVIIEKLELNDRPVAVVLPVENAGTTPANEWVIQWAWAVTGDKPTSEMFDATLAKYPVQGTQEATIGPRQVKEIPYWLTIAAEGRNKVMAGEMQLYIMGKMFYLDVFGEQHVTEFFYSYTENLPNRLGQMNVRNNVL